MEFLDPPHEGKRLFVDLVNSFVLFYSKCVMEMPCAFLCHHPLHGTKLLQIPNGESSQANFRGSLGVIMCKNHLGCDKFLNLRECIFVHSHFRPCSSSWFNGFRTVAKSVKICDNNSQVPRKNRLTEHLVVEVHQ